MRINSSNRRSAEATGAYFDLLALDTRERAREAFYPRFNLVEYVNSSVQSNIAERVRGHLALLCRAVAQAKEDR